MFFGELRGRRSESRKTRIETQGAYHGRGVGGGVVEVNPEKQGLKLVAALMLANIASPVVEVNPEKQGLKPRVQGDWEDTAPVVEVNPEKQGLKPG